MENQFEADRQRICQIQTGGTADIFFLLHTFIAFIIYDYNTHNNDRFFLTAQYSTRYKDDIYRYFCGFYAHTVIKIYDCCGITVRYIAYTMGYNTVAKRKRDKLREKLRLKLRDRIKNLLLHLVY